MPQGRVPLLDEALQRELLVYVAAGNTYKVAAEAVGISVDSLMNWQRKGARAIKRRDAGQLAEENDDIYINFVNALKKAKAQSIATAVGHVRRAMPGNWTAAMTFLERRDPEHWGRRDRVDLHASGVVGVMKIAPEDVKMIQDNLHTFFPSLGGGHDEDSPPEA